MPNIFGDPHKWERNNANGLDPSQFGSVGEFQQAYLRKLGLDPSNPGGVLGSNNHWNTDAGNIYTQYQSTHPQQQAGTPPSGQPPTGQGPGKGPQSFEDYLRQYLEELNKGVDFNDPRVKYALGQSQQMAADQAKRRGITGPMAVGQAQNAYTQAQAGLMGQNGQQRLNALQTGLQYDINNQRLQLDRNQANYDIAQSGYQNQLDEWTRNHNNNAGLGGAIGGLLGGAAGLGVGLLGGPATAGFIPQLMSGGAGIGGGIGSFAGSGRGPPPPRYNGPTRV